MIALTVVALIMVPPASAFLVAYVVARIACRIDWERIEQRRAEPQEGGD